MWYNLSSWRTWGVRPAAQGSQHLPPPGDHHWDPCSNPGVSKRFFPGSPVFPSPQNQHFKIPIRPGMVDKEPLCGCATFFLFSKGWLVIHSPFVPASRYESTLHFERILPKSGNTGLKRHQGLEIRRVQGRISVHLSREVWINYLRCPYVRPYGGFQPWAGRFQSSLGHEGTRARSLKGRVALIHD